MKLLGLVGFVVAQDNYGNNGGDGGAEPAKPLEPTTVSWNGYVRVDKSDDYLTAREITYCGMNIVRPSQSLKNSTCTISTDSEVYRMYAGNGAFITKNGDLTGFDLTSDFVQLNLEFMQNDQIDFKYVSDLTPDELDFYYDNPQRDNTTCFGDVEISCTPNAGGLGLDDIMFMETINANNGPGTYNFQIANYGEPGTSFIVSLFDIYSNPVGVGHVNTTQGVVAVEGDQIVFTVEDNGPLLFGFSAYCDATPDLFQSSIESDAY